MSNAPASPTSAREVNQFDAEERRLWKQITFNRHYMDHGAILIWVDRYVRTGSGTPPGDLEDATGAPLSFNAVQAALQRGYRPHYLDFAYKIDAEANVLTALICHTDGGKPGNVCDRAVIKHILKHVK